GGWWAGGVPRAGARGGGGRFLCGGGAPRGTQARGKRKKTFFFSLLCVWGLGPTAVMRFFRYVLLFLLDLQRGADGPQHRFVLGQVEVRGLAEDEHGALGRVEAARPAGVEQVEAEKGDVVPDGPLAGEFLHLFIGL